jgi:chromosomal replication initiation ATPase DnaA
MMQQWSLSRAVLAARSASREEVKMTAVPARQWRDWQSQHDAHVKDFKLDQAAYELALAQKRQWLLGSTFDKIRLAVCAQFGVSEAEIMSHRRLKHIARSRQVCMYLAKNFTSHSYPQIARKCGGFDHSTVIHAVNRIAALRTINPELDAAITAVENKLQLKGDVDE